MADAAMSVVKAAPVAEDVPIAVKAAPSLPMLLRRSRPHLSPLIFLLLKGRSSRRHLLLRSLLVAW